MKAKELIKILHRQAKEIAKAGLPGWGNTMSEAAEALKKLEAENRELRREGYETPMGRSVE